MSPDDLGARAPGQALAVPLASGQCVETARRAEATKYKAGQMPLKLRLRAHGAEVYV